MISYIYPFNKSLSVTSQTTHLTPHTFPNGRIWEFDEIQYFYQKVFDSKKEKLVIVDIGAQTGLYSLFAKYVDNATFYSYEPYTPCYDELNRNLELNGITNVKTYNIAISNKKGLGILRVPNHKGLCTLGNNPKRFNEYETFEVQCDTLDNLFYDKNIPVNFIKCDTEGWEYYILQGGVKTIQKYRPIIQLEYSPINMSQCCVTSKMFDKLIEDISYTCTHKSSEEYIFEFKE
jgi:FkbM family methyltransferase